jgi:hypothetical protein
MAVKTMQTRIQQKTDIEANWNQSDLVPFAGELIVYAPDSEHAASRLKIGDGVTIVKNLPFVNVDAADLDNITAARVAHKLIFGDGAYQYDGSEQVVVPVYDGQYNDDNI